LGIEGVEVHVYTNSTRPENIEPAITANDIVVSSYNGTTAALNAIAAAHIGTNGMLHHVAFDVGNGPLPFLRHNPNHNSVQTYCFSSSREIINKRKKKGLLIGSHNTNNRSSRTYVYPFNEVNILNYRGLALL
jgi:hypothetical protein